MLLLLIAFVVGYTGYFVMSKFKIIIYFYSFSDSRSHGVMVSTLDSESSDPSSNLGGT